MNVTALAGGVGAARLLRGMVQVVPPADVTAIVNTGDDFVLHGLQVCPDLDTLTYTLAGEVDPDTGWGLGEESWAVMQSLSRYGSDLAWFGLGDRDLATHLYRTGRIIAGAMLSEVAAEVASAWGIESRLLPMTDFAVETRIRLRNDDGTAAADEIGFQEYFVRLAHSVAVADLRFEGIEEARPGPGVTEALASADAVVICPSNPVVSIGPILAVPGIEDAVGERRDHVVAVSPLIAGEAVKGPAARLMREMGHESSVVGVARLYAPIAAVLVIDEADAALAADVEAEGMSCVVAPTLMTDTAHAAALARTCLSAVGVDPPG